MTRQFVELPSFRAEWKAMSLSDSDLRRLQEELLVNPAAGAVMRGTGGVRKMRFSFEHRGKSGSVRVIYIDFEMRGKLYLIAAYPKNEKDNLSSSERNELKKLVAILETELEKNDKR